MPPGNHRGHHEFSAPSALAEEELLPRGRPRLATSESEPATSHVEVVLEQPALILPPADDLVVGQPTTAPPPVEVPVMAQPVLPPVPAPRRSTRQGAGQNRNPGNLPRSALSQGHTSQIDRDVLANVAESQLLLARLLARQ